MSPTHHAQLTISTWILILSVFVFTVRHTARGEGTPFSIPIKHFTSRNEPFDWTRLSVTAKSLTVTRNGGDDNQEGSDPPTVLSIHQLTGGIDPTHLAGRGSLEYISEFRTYYEEQGNRRAQSTVCDTEQSTLESCFPSQECADCFKNQFQAFLFLGLASGISACANIENIFCSIAPKCSCGCETEAESFYTCLAEDVTLGGCTIDCSNPRPLCDAEFSVADSCFVSTSTASCIDCVDDLFAAGERSTCNVLESRYCTAIYDTCDCGICTTEVEELYDCVYSQTVCEGLQCDETPQPPTTGSPMAPTPTPAPGSELECDAEYTAAGSCVSNINPSCPDCVYESLAALFDENSEVYCSVFEFNVCNAVYNTCGCGNCADKVEDFFFCAYSGSCTGLQCDNSGGDGGGAGASICLEEQSLLEDCLPSQECASCFNDSFQQVADQASSVGMTCGSIENALCAIAPDCSCGCEGEAEAYYGCIVEDANDGICLIDCSDTQCDTEMNAADDCLAAFNSSCSQCVSDSIDFLFAGNEQISCSEFESKSCTAIYDICGCESCADEFESYFFCLMADSGCGELECSPLEVSPPSGSPATPTPPPIIPSPLPEKTFPPQTDTPIKDEDTNASPSSSDSGGFNTGYLAALVAIPLIVVVLYLAKHNKSDMDPKSNVAPTGASSVKHVGETPPITPVQTNQSYAETCEAAPDSPNRQTEESMASSRRSADDYGTPGTPRDHSEPSVTSSISFDEEGSIHETGMEA